MKFTDRGEVSLRIRETLVRDSHIGLCFEVEDTGVGIAPEQLPQLFTPFQQLDSAMNRRFEGTGLGLAICRKLAELMGGRVLARSQAGVGSTFSFEVSLEIAGADRAAGPDSGLRHADTAVSDGRSLAGPEWQALHGRTVLLVEDNPINQEVARGLLELVGMDVHVAGDGSRALAALKEHAFDIVLMDIHMPGMDGIETTGAIRHGLGLQALPVLALTADAMSADRIRCIEGGMNDHISKPIDPAAMFRTIAAWLPPVAKPGARIAARQARGQGWMWRRRRAPCVSGGGSPEGHTGPGRRCGDQALVRSRGSLCQSGRARMRRTRGRGNADP
ncbi:response regulator [Cupriavidus basilensis]